MELLRTYRRTPDTQKLAFVGDVHVPFHDRVAVSLMLGVLDWFQPDWLYLIGDIVDFYTLSSFDQDPDRVDRLQEELDETVELLDEIRRVVGPKCRIVYREGNHEFRLTKFLWKHPKVATLRSMQLPELLEFNKNRIVHSGYNRFLAHRGFLVEHGDIVRKHSGYTASGMLEKRGRCGITGHTHRLGVHHRTDMNGHKVWYENGCLCGLEPEYVIGTPNWQQGFTLAYFWENRFEAEQVRIWNNRLYHHGGLWEVNAEDAKAASDTVVGDIYLSRDELQEVLRDPTT